MARVYYQGQELPDIPVRWEDGDGDLHDFSTGHTFTVQVYDTTDPLTVLVSKATGITGAATDPNVTIGWATSGELSTLTPADSGTEYGVHLWAKRSSDSKDNKFPAPITFTLYPAPA